MGIRPLLSSITRRPQEGPWRRTGFRSVGGTISPFVLSVWQTSAGILRPSDWIVDLPSRIGVVVTAFCEHAPGVRASFAARATTSTFEWSRLDAASNQASKPCLGQVWRLRSTALAPEEQCSQITVAAPLICGREWCDRRSRFVSVPDRAMPQSRGLYRKHHPSCAPLRFKPLESRKIIGFVLRTARKFQFKDALS